MQTPRSFAPWSSSSGQQVPAFSHLKAVPPPPMGSSLTPSRLPYPFSTPHPTIGAQNRNFRNGKSFSPRGQHRGRGQNKRGKPNGALNQQARSSNKKVTQTSFEPSASATVSKLTCDTCDKAFPDEVNLAEHIAQHTVCGLEGCKFSAHPKVVANHVDMQHRTGLYKRLITGADPDEIKRWREERKNRFPTRANVELKQMASQEKSARGERIDEPRGRFSHRGRGHWNQIQSRPNHEKRVNYPVSNLNMVEKNKQEEKMLCNTLQAETKSNEVQTNIKSNPILPRALASLAGNYASSDSDSDAAPEEVAIGHELSGPEPVHKKIKVEPPAPPVHEQRHPRNFRHQPTVRQQYLAKRRPPTLLQKLLESEIRHERNVILQCVRHIVQHNFFQ